MSFNVILYHFKFIILCDRTPYLFNSQNYKVLLGRTLRYVQICCAELMVFKVIWIHWYKPFYETVCQRLTRTSLFMKGSDRVSLGQATSFNWKWI